MKDNAISPQTMNFNQSPNFKNISTTLETLLLNMPDVVMLIDREATIHYINRTLPEYTVADVMGTKATAYLSKEDSDAYMACLNKVYETEEAGSLEVSATGPTKWLVRLTPIKSENLLKLVMVIASDITERKWMEDTIKFIVKQTDSSTGEDYFKSLVKTIAMILNVRYALVCECVDVEMTRARTIAIWNRDRFEENMEYNLKGTPCAIVTKGRMCFYPKNVQEFFPDDKMLKVMKVESYLGIPFFNPLDNMIGYLVIMDDKPMGKNDKKILSIFKIFADRATTELQRKKAQEMINMIQSDLEQRVDERTRELEQKNLALKEILSQIEIEKKQIKDDVVANVDQLLVPLVSKLKRRGGVPNQKYIELLEENLDSLTSKFGGKVSEAKLKLTPKEIEICNMIKNGLSSKEIAGLLNSSCRTVEIHRSNIRKKLGLAHKSVNLSTYLQSF